ncbi:hypothetical protein MJ561_22525 [Klebsiella pneumoniae]|nr:hypothetical protein MJ561_22525 [Klebsiella pneumoniae]
MGESGRGTNAIDTALAIDGGCRVVAVSTAHPQPVCTARRCRSSDRTGIAEVLDISGPANFPPAHLWLGKSGGKAN